MRGAGAPVLRLVACSLQTFDPGGAAAPGYAQLRLPRTAFSSAPKRAIFGADPGFESGVGTEMGSFWRRGEVCGQKGAPAHTKSGNCWIRGRNQVYLHTEYGLCPQKCPFLWRKSEKNGIRPQIRPFLWRKSTSPTFFGPEAAFGSRVGTDFGRIRRRGISVSRKIATFAPTPWWWNGRHEGLRSVL